MPPRPPHILQITCHDLGRHIGCCGARTVHTPALDRIAAEGVRFERSFCTSPGCSPSRAALATGRYPHSTGVLGLAHAHFGWALAPSERHIAALLRDAGYRTVLCGLQHVTYDLPGLGFAEIYPERPADGVVRNVERVLREAASGATPLYLELNFFEPHRPFDFGGVAPDREHGVRIPPYLPNTPAVEEEIAALQGAIRKVDTAVGRIEDVLGDTGLRDRTILLFTADHGLALPRAKGTLYDPGIETALLVRWPAGGVAGGRVHSQLVSNIDVLPTLLELAGLEVPEVVQGKSAAPLLRGETYLERREVFAEKTFHNEYDPLRCIRTADHKLIARFEVANPVEAPADIMQGAAYREVAASLLQPTGHHFELYDLRADPLERVNLAGREETRELERDLRKRLLRWMEETDDPLLGGPVASPFYYAALRRLREE